MTECPDLEDAKLMLGAMAIVLGKDHTATLALAQAFTTRGPEDIEASRLALRALPRDMRAAIAEAVEQPGRRRTPEAGVSCRLENPLKAPRQRHPPFRVGGNAVRGQYTHHGRPRARGGPAFASPTDQSLDARENRTDTAPMVGKSRSERIASVWQTERDRLIDRARNITSLIEHAKMSARTLDEAEFEKSINRKILDHFLSGMLGVLTGVLLIAAVAAVLR